MTRTQSKLLRARRHECILLFLPISVFLPGMPDGNQATNHCVITLTNKYNMTLILCPPLLMGDYTPVNPEAL